MTAAGAEVTRDDDPDPEVLRAENFHYYARLRDTAASFLPAARLKTVDAAFLLADRAHCRQRRASGEPYIIHPIAVATIIAQLRLDAESVTAALLHDVVEDTDLTEDDIERQFGRRVRELVDGVTKLDKLRFHDYREAQAENFRKMILAMTKDIRVILIKLADRTHNMRTLGALRPDKRVRIARETLEVFAPIANRLGIADLKAELEELGLAALYPMRYRVLKAAVSRARQHRRETVTAVVDVIRERLDEAGITARVTGREKQIYSIYRKMVQKELPFREIMDIYAFRIVVADVDTCYLVLGKMHALFKPRPGGFKDYVAIPKINGYQSLHTSLVGPHGVPLELQIRTDFMDQMAARGVAAHWAYKENGSEPVSTASQKNAQQWLRNLADLQQSASNSLEFVEDVKTDLVPDTIFVFTPEGKIYDLPHGATPVDFAFAVHTDLGLHCIGARVNHRAFPLSRPLESGQSVEIITAAAAVPNTIWLASVVTAKARARIRQYLKGLRTQECELIGRRILSTALRTLRVPAITPAQMAQVLGYFQLPEESALYAEIGVGNILTAAVIKVAQPQLSLPARGAAAVTGLDGMPYTMAGCCLPIPGDEIVAQLTGGRGVVIHGADCPNLQRQRGETAGKRLQVQWDLNVTRDLEFQTRLRVAIKKRQNAVAEISNAVEIAGSRIESIHSEVRDGETFMIKLTVTVRDRLHLAGVMRRIKAVADVIRIYRH